MYNNNKGRDTIMENAILLEKTKQDAIRKFMPSQEVLILLASYFQAYSDPTRIKILSALSMSEMCVNDLSRLLNINQTTVSHQLKLLRTLGMVKYRRDGKIIYYSLSNTNVNDIMLKGVNHILGENSKIL